MATASALDIADDQSWCNVNTVGVSAPNPFDRTSYYYCSFLGTNETEVLTLQCAPGTGFVDNNEVIGCVSWREWTCTYKGEAQQNQCCSSANTRCSDVNPTVYWQCENGTSQAKQCPNGFGFIDYNGLASCIFWDQWFNICEEIQSSLGL